MLSQFRNTIDHLFFVDFFKISTVNCVIINHFLIRPQLSYPIPNQFENMRVINFAQRSQFKLKMKIIYFCIRLENSNCYKWSTALHAEIFGNVDFCIVLISHLVKEHKASIKNINILIHYFKILFIKI